MKIFSGSAANDRVEFVNPARNSISESRPLSQSALITGASLATLLNGLANLYLVISTSHHAHPPKWLEAFPLEFLRLPRTFTLAVGFALIISAFNIYKRKKRAFQIVIGLAVFSAILHLAHSRHFEQAAMAIGLILILWQARRNFTVKSRVPDLRAGIIRLSIATTAAFAYGVFGFWLLDKREFGVNFNWLDSILRTVRFLTLVGDSSLKPHTRYALWFLDSLTMMTVVVIVYALWSLFRPIVYHFGTQPSERDFAVRIANRNGRSALDYFKLWPDKSYFFSRSSEGFVAYRVSNGFAVALGDPLASTEQIEQTIRDFKNYCEEQGWQMAFHQAHPDLLAVYSGLGLRKLKIGDDAIVDLAHFSLEGKEMKRYRYRINQLERQGYKLQYYPAPVTEELVRQLREVSDEWLRIPGRRERTFTVGQFDEAYLRNTPIVTAEEADGKIQAFVNIIPSGLAGETTIDLMRHRQDAPNGIMDYLFIKLFLLSREQGFTRFNLGMAPMSGFQENEQATFTERVVHWLFQRLNFVFSFSGLRQYKAKYADFWEPRYLIYRHFLDLPELGLALARIAELPGQGLPSTANSWQCCHTLQSGVQNATENQISSFV